MTWTRWSDQSRADIDYYEQFDRELAGRVEQALVEAPAILMDHPRAGSAGGRGLRKWRVPGFPPILLYRFIERGVEIARVGHTAQNWRQRH